MASDFYYFTNQYKLLKISSCAWHLDMKNISVLAIYCRILLGTSLQELLEHTYKISPDTTYFLDQFHRLSDNLDILPALINKHLQKLLVLTVAFSLLDLSLSLGKLCNNVSVLFLIFSENVIIYHFCLFIVLRDLSIEQKT